MIGDSLKHVNNRYPLLPVLPVVLCDAGKGKALLHPDYLAEVGPAVRAAEGDVRGVIYHALQTLHAHGVTAGQLPGLLEDVPAHRARQQHLQLGFLLIGHVAPTCLPVKAGEQEERAGEG